MALRGVPAAREYSRTGIDGALDPRGRSPPRRDVGVTTPLDHFEVDAPQASPSPASLADSSDASRRVAGSQAL